MRKLTLALIAVLVSAFVQAESGFEVVQQAVDKINFTELAAIYNEIEVKNSLGEDVPFNDETKSAALLVDLGVIVKSDFNDLSRLQGKLKRYVDDFTHVDENYIGNISDKNIYERVRHKWNTASLIIDNNIIGDLNRAIDQGLITGYGLYAIKDNPHFNPVLTVRYSHSDIKHALQLIGLMRRVNLDAKVQLVAKTSAYLYHPEWKEPSGYIVQSASGKQVIMSKGYNLYFEFAKQDEMLELIALVKKHAKRDQKDEQGLIWGAWWQPFLRTYVKMPGYSRLGDNYFEFAGYHAEMITLALNSKPLLQGFAKISKRYQLHTRDTWVNPAFYRFMLGNFK